MVPEAPLERSDAGLAPSADGWFVLNARDASWRHAAGRGALCDFEGDREFAQLGVTLWALGPGEPMSMYHWEADQEDFLVLAGEALLVVEGEERSLRAWDLVHCPSGTRHTIVGAGGTGCIVFAVGARQHAGAPDWGGYTVDAVARRHGAGVELETSDPRQAYAHVPRRTPTEHRDGWLPA